MFACTEKECPREVVQKRRPSEELARFQAQQQRASQVLERKQRQEELRHQQKVEALQRRPAERGDAAATPKQKDEHHAQLVLRRRAHLQQIRRGQLLHELQLKAAKLDKPLAQPKTNKVERSQQVQRNKLELQAKRQRDAERGLRCRNVMAEARIDQIKRNKLTAQATLKQKNAVAGQRALDKGERFKRMQMDIVKNQLQVKNMRADYVLGVQPAAAVKSLYKPRAKVAPTPFVPPKYHLLEKTYNLEFLRLKFKSDAEKWWRRHRDLRLASVDEMVDEWKLKCRFEDPELQLGEVQKELSNAEEMLQLEQRVAWISAPVSVQVMREVGLAACVCRPEEYAALGVAAQIAVSQQMRRKQNAAVDAEIDRRLRRWAERGGGAKLAQLVHGQGVDKEARTRSPDKLDYAKLLYGNVLQRWKAD